MSDFVPVMEPAVVTAMREVKQALLLREEAQMQEMARRWMQVENALEAQISALAQEMAELQEAGKSVSDGKLFRMARYQTLLGQTQEEVKKYISYTERLVSEGQAELASRGIEDAATNIRMSYEDGIGVYFDRLPVEAVENMVGLAGDGKPLGRLLKQRMAVEAGADGLETWNRLTQTLINGTAQGWNPRKTARRMKDDLAGGLQKALTIARSEQLRVYREATRQQYIRSGVVEGYKRLCAHDSRVCAACLALDGEFSTLDVPMFDHPQGRCTTIAVVQGAPEKTWLAGEDWLKTQPEEVQRSILGQARFEAWKAGKIDFRKLATKTHDATWGMGLKVTPIQELFASGISGKTVELHNLVQSNQVLSVGDIHQEIVTVWGGNAKNNLGVVVTGERRSHYLEHHPDIKGIEDEIIHVLLDPSIVCRNKKDKKTLIFYREYDDFYLRAAVLMQQEESWKKHSVMSFRFAREKEYESDKEKRLLWKK